MQGNLSRQELVLHYLSLCLVPMPPFCGLKVQETFNPSDLFSSSPLLMSSIVMTLCYTTDYPQSLVVDRMTMRCLIRPPYTCDSDVAGPGATLSDDTMEVLRKDTISLCYSI